MILYICGVFGGVSVGVCGRVWGRVEKKSRAVDVARDCADVAASVPVKAVSVTVYFAIAC